MYFRIAAKLIPSIINPHTLSLAVDFARSSANFNYLYDKLITKETSSKLFIRFFFCSFVDTRRKKQIICTIALSVMQVKLFGISIIGRSLKNRISLLLLHYLNSNLVFRWGFLGRSYLAFFPHLQIPSITSEGRSTLKMLLGCGLNPLLG